MGHRVQKLFIRVLCLLLVLLLLIPTLPQMSLTVFADGPSGSWSDYADTTWCSTVTDNTYSVTSAEQLAGLAVLVNSGMDFNGKTVNLTQSIYLSDHHWQSIGNSSYIYDEEEDDFVDVFNVFSGTFDGNGHEIWDLNISTENDYQGLFGIGADCIIKNVVMMDENIEGGTSIGGIAGKITNSSITNCSVAGTISGYATIGGIAGYAPVGSNQSLIISNCYNTSTVDGTQTVGGLVGHIGSTGGETVVSDCYNTGSITAQRYVGGVVGSQIGTGGSVTITRCFNKGSLLATRYLGGLLGRNTTSGVTESIQNCYNVGTITVGGYGTRSNAGGILGQKGSATLSNTYYIGYVGGVGKDADSTATDIEGQATPFLKLSRSSFSTGLQATIVEQDANNIKTALNSTFGDDFNLEYPASFGSSSVEVATIEGTTVTGATPGTTNITGTLTITQNTLTATGFNGASYPMAINLSMPITITVPLWSDYGDTSWYDSHPTQTSFSISTSDQLAGLASIVNNGTDDFTGNTINLTGSVNLSAYYWTPIGTIDSYNNQYAFRGTFNGGNHTVSCLNTRASQNYQGLFGFVAEGTVENIGVLDGNISGNYSVGGIAGYLENGSIINCYNAGTVSGDEQAGGIVGVSYNEDGTSTLSNCYNTGAINCSSGVGGILGYNLNEYAGIMSISSCYNTGSVSGSDNVGGILGGNLNYGSAVTISNCYSVGTITGSGGYVGGLAGDEGTSTLSNLYYTGYIGGVGQSGSAAATDVDGTIPFAKIANSPLNVDHTTITEQQTSSIRTAWSSVLGSDFAVSYPDSYTSSNTSKATTSTIGGVKKITGVALGSTNITGTMTITQNGLTPTGFSGATYQIPVSLSIPLLMTNIVPGAPTAVTTTAGKWHAVVNFTPPESNGGSAVTGYTVNTYKNGVLQNGLSASGSESPITVGSLTNNTNYTFKVIATNAVGSSAESAESAQTTPFEPQISGGSSQSSAPIASTPVVVVAQQQTPIETPPSTPAPVFTAEPTPETTVAPTPTASPVPTPTEDPRAGLEPAPTEESTPIPTEILLPAEEPHVKTIAAPVPEENTLFIPMTTDNNISVGQVSGDTIQAQIDNSSVMEINTETASYSIPASEIKIQEIAQQFGNNIEIKDISVSITIENLSQEAVKVVENTGIEKGFTIVAPPVEFKVTATSGDKTVEVDKFDNFVEKTIRIPDGVDPSKITTGIVVNFDGTVRSVPTRIVVIDGKYYAKLNSLTNSIYSVIYHQVEFKDVKNHWAKEAINNMGSRMIVTGTSSNMFRPDRDITRAEFVTMVVKGLGLSPSMAKQEFSDVGVKNPNFGYVNTAYKYGLVSGYGDGKFGPNTKITREEAMTIMARMMKVAGLNSELELIEIRKIISRFSDSKMVSTWSKESIAKCLNAGIVEGRDNKTLAPKENITRAEATVMIEKLLQKANLI